MDGEKDNFYQRIALVGKRIPYGKAATYGQIALLCGKPQNSRQVGYALRRELAGEDFPAHRVVNSQGYLSGAAAFAGTDTQKQLLFRERIEVSEDNRVNLKKYGWQHTLAEAVALYELFEQLHI